MVCAVKFYFRYKDFHRISSFYFIFTPKPPKMLIFCGFRAFCYFFTVNIMQTPF